MREIELFKGAKCEFGFWGGGGGGKGKKERKRLSLMS